MLKGSIPAIITPFSKGEVDFDSFAKLLKWQIKEGISGEVWRGAPGYRLKKSRRREPAMPWPDASARP